MKGSRTKPVLAVGLIGLAVALFFILKPGDSEQDAPNSSTVTGKTGSPASKAAVEPKPAPIPKVRFRNGEVKGGELDIEVKEGGQIEFKVSSDVDEEVHVHGYDISRDVVAGGTVTIDFKADITGIFEAEMENSGVPVAKLQINP